MKKTPIDKFNKPTSRNRAFTYSENQLLDQITLEITEAWAKDLKTIRECYKEIKFLQEGISNCYELFSDKMDQINELLEKEEGIYKLEHVLINQEQIFSFINDMRSQILSLSNSLEYKNVTNITEELKKITAMIKEVCVSINQLQEVVKKPKKKWWQIFFQCD